MALALTLEPGQSAVVEVPYVDEDGTEGIDTITVTFAWQEGRRAGIRIDAPREFNIRRSAAEPRTVWDGQKVVGKMIG